MKLTTIILFIISGLIILIAGVGAIRCLATGERAEALYTSTAITCGACAEKLSQALRPQAGVGKVAVDVASQQVRVAFDPQQTDPGSIAIAMTAAGYAPRLLAVGEPGAPAAQSAPTGSGCACCVNKPQQ